MTETKIVSARLPGGGAVGIEVTELTSVDTERPVAAINFQFKDVLTPIEAVAREIGGLLQRVNPSKAAVEFAIEIGAESGQLTALLVKGTGKANLKITLNWDAIIPADEKNGETHQESSEGQ